VENRESSRLVKSQSASLQSRKVHREKARTQLVSQLQIATTSKAHFDDEYEHYNFDHDKHIFSGHSGKQRSKKEATEHTNHFDPSGHSRKILTKLMNTNNNKKAAAVCAAGMQEVTGKEESERKEIFEFKEK